MKGGSIPDQSQDVGNVSEEEVATNAETAVVPVFAGEQPFALQWLCEPFNQFTQEAPAERPGKK